ncbi:methyltransferase domain-containing protein [Propionibacterium acidifaciens]|uniref:methyltransferase domain-containing protein n=1 Tax=Propionibacterium acidifaciens TaxID=556499 RepID=UPI0009DC1D72|nr:methyltransferase domain-containing protein [Propionibacterium acidifaciens]
MRRILLTVLRCPACGSAVMLASSMTDGPQIESGTLKCSGCERSYAIIDSVPRMLVEGNLDRHSVKGFSFQWKVRQGGAGEDTGVIYGYRIPQLVEWMSQTFFSHLDTTERQQWILDAGCGSAEKSAELAVRYPQHQVVAIDQSTAIRQTAARFGDVANLHFVQGDVLRPPLLAGAFNQVISIGVLHHTRSTQAAFDKVADLVEPRGGLFVWLYPREGEDSFWDGLYRQRDHHFAGLGSKLPIPLVMAWCRLYVKMFSNQIKDFLVREHERNCQIFPPEIYPVFHNRAEMIRSAVFLSFDNVMPRYQFRHGSQEVIGWYEAKGFGAPNTSYPGFFAARRSKHSDAAAEDVSAAESQDDE